MRQEAAPASLGELLGKASEQKDLNLEDLPKILGEKMPDLPKNRIGKFRLMNALQQRFGNGFKNVPMVSKIIKQFDAEVELENTIRLNKKGQA
jgi:hypothetical protein